MKLDLLRRAVPVALLRRPFMSREELVDEGAFTKLKEKYTPQWRWVTLLTPDAIAAVMFQRLGGEKGLAQFRVNIMYTVYAWLLVMLGLVAFALFFMTPALRSLAPIFLLLPLAVYLRTLFLLYKAHKATTVNGFAMLCTDEIKARQYNSVQLYACRDKLVAHHLMVSWYAALLDVDVQFDALCGKAFRDAMSEIRGFAWDFSPIALDFSGVGLGWELQVLVRLVGLLPQVWALWRLRDLSTWFKAHAPEFGRKYSVAKGNACDAGGQVAHTLRASARIGSRALSFRIRLLCFALVAVPPFVIVAIVTRGDDNDLSAFGATCAAWGASATVVFLLNHVYWEPLYKARDGLTQIGRSFVKQGDSRDPIDQVTGLALAALTALETAPLPGKDFEALQWTCAGP